MATSTQITLRSSRPQMVPGEGMAAAGGTVEPGGERGSGQHPRPSLCIRAQQTGCGDPDLGTRLLRRMALNTPPEGLPLPVSLRQAWWRVCVLFTKAARAGRMLGSATDPRVVCPRPRGPCAEFLKEGQ